MPTPRNKCPCDACDAPRGADSDGYCDGCATRCFPVGRGFGGAPMRVAMSPSSRRAMHGGEAVAPSPARAPQDPVDLRGRLVDAALDAFAPVVEREGRRLLAALRRRAGGR